jgi:hypothetical protein
VPEVLLMPADIQWFDEDRSILEIVYPGDLSLDDADLARQEVDALLAANQIDHRVDLVINLLEVRRFPLDLFRAGNGLSASSFPTGGSTVLITDNPSVRQRMKVTPGVYADGFVVSSRAEAALVIQLYRARATS